MVVETLAAAETLAEAGVAAEVIDVATLKPLDMATILASVEKTGRCVIVHEAPLTSGFGAEIAARLADQGLMNLLAPLRRVAGYDTVMPLPRLEGIYMPSTARIAEGGQGTLGVRMSTFRLPDLGEGLQEAEIVAWHVGVGDHVVADQPLVSVETEKAVVEIPSPQAGRIAKLHHAVGDIVPIGGALVDFGEAAATEAGTVVGRIPEETAAGCQGRTCRSRRQESRRRRRCVPWHAAWASTWPLSRRAEPGRPHHRRRR